MIGAHGMARPLHIICERYVGMFSLVQQTIAHVPWALAEKRCPIAFFGPGCSYWTLDGYAGANSVWEYYFEPLIERCGVNSIPDRFKEQI